MTKRLKSIDVATWTVPPLLHPTQHLCRVYWVNGKGIFVCGTRELDRGRRTGEKFELTIDFTLKQMWSSQHHFYGQSIDPFISGHHLDQTKHCLCENFWSFKCQACCTWLSVCVVYMQDFTNCCAFLISIYQDFCINMILRCEYTSKLH